MAMMNAAPVAMRDPSDDSSPQLNFDIPDALLAEVDFKWLMAGHGWRIDMTRFGDDPEYARRLLDWARQSDSAPLRECAAVLLTHIDNAGKAGRGPAG